MSTVARRTKASVIATKIKRIRDGGSIRTLDLLSGCGGLSLGFHSAGFEIAASVEFDAFAARSHAKNFFDDESGPHSAAIDITETSPTEVVEKFNLRQGSARK